MTTQSYPWGWGAGSKVSGKALAPSGYAWNVNLNNGNSNRNNQTNDNHVRAVRVGECQDAVSFRDLHAAWREARRGKVPSLDQTGFDARWTDRLFEIRDRLNAGTWKPQAPTCFIATAPKAREIHAPAFADRVVHHYVVPRLEAIYEPTFIHDSFSNRKGKGTHASVARLRAFVREVASGQGGGFYLQLDIRNFFNSIHRPTLYRLLKARMERAGLALPLRRAVHALLDHSTEKTGVFYACTEAERAAVPAHKRLENSAPGCGIAIGNLSSQFFANVYLDQLDQFVKHALKVQRYVRYVDDFVLVHRDLVQLDAWKLEIQAFLTRELGLDLKADQRLRPLAAGIDFLGYVIYPTHTVVRRRVVAHARARLADWERRHVRDGHVTHRRRHLEALRSMYASYAGHFSHASSYRLRCRLFNRFTWLAEALPRKGRV